nr:hypothetical protein [Molussus totiviridae 1]
MSQSPSTSSLAKSKKGKKRLRHLFTWIKLTPSSAEQALTEPLPPPGEEDEDRIFWEHFGEAEQTVLSEVTTSVEMESTSASSSASSGVTALLDSARIVLAQTVTSVATPSRTEESVIVEARKDYGQYKAVFERAAFCHLLQTPDEWYRTTSLRLGATPFAFLPLCKPTISAAGDLNETMMLDKAARALTALTQWAPKPCGGVRFWQVKEDLDVQPAEFLTSFRSDTCPICGSVTNLDGQNDYCVAINCIHVFGSYLFDLRSASEIEPVGAYYAESTWGGQSVALLGGVGLLYLYYFTLLIEALKVKPGTRAAAFCHTTRSLSSTRLSTLMREMGTSLLSHLKWQAVKTAPGLVQSSTSGDPNDSVPKILQSSTTDRVVVTDEISIPNVPQVKALNLKHNAEETFRRKMEVALKKDNDYTAITQEVSAALGQVMSQIDTERAKVVDLRNKLNEPITAERAGSKKRAEKLNRQREAYHQKMESRIAQLDKLKDEAAVLTAFANSIQALPTNRRVYFSESILKGYSPEIQNIIALSAAIDNLHEQYATTSVLAPGRGGARRQMRNRHTRTWTNEQVWAEGSSSSDDPQTVAEVADLARLPPEHITTRTDFSSTTTIQPHVKEETTGHSTVSPDWTAFKGIARNNAECRAYVMLQKCQGHSHRIRGLIFRWSSDPVMLSALSRALKRLLGEQARSALPFESS